MTEPPSGAAGPRVGVYVTEEEWWPVPSLDDGDFLKEVGEPLHPPFGLPGP